MHILNCTSLFGSLAYTLLQSISLVMHLYNAFLYFAYIYNVLSQFAHLLGACSFFNVQGFYAIQHSTSFYYAFLMHRLQDPFSVQPSLCMLKHAFLLSGQFLSHVLVCSLVCTRCSFSSKSYFHNLLVCVLKRLTPLVHYFKPTPTMLLSVRFVYTQCLSHSVLLSTHFLIWA